MTTTDRAEHVFDLSGGAVCLDFTNTVGGRGREAPVERLRGYSDLVAWARQSDLVDRRRSAGLVRWAEERPAEAAAVLAEAIELREGLFRLFAALVSGRRAPAGDLAALNRWLPRALARQRLVRSGDGFAWGWVGGGGAGDSDSEGGATGSSDDLEAPIWPVVRSAAELLTGGDLADLRECADSGCRWLFLDRSRNHSRRWCDMKSCGNRAKVRRHYRRQRREGAAG